MISNALAQISLQLEDSKNLIQLQSTSNRAQYNIWLIGFIPVPCLLIAEY